MVNGNRLLKDTLLYSVANFGSKILVFLMLPLYTHYFTTAEYGLWDIVVTTVTLLTPFITFELVAAVYRWLLVEKSMAAKQRIITTGAITILRNLIIFNGLCAILFTFISIPYDWQALLFADISIFTSFMQQCARGLGYNKLFALIGILQTTITVILNLIFILLLNWRLEAFFYSAIIAGTCVVIMAWIVMRFNGYITKTSYSKAIVKSFLVYSIPIIPGAASWWVMTMSDRYMIGLFLGMEANGIYAIANKIPAILLMVSSVFSLAWKDHAILAFDSEDKNTYYSKVFKHFFRLMTTSVICLTLLTKPILALVIASGFYSSWKYIGVLLLATLFSAFSQFWGAGFHGARKTNVIFISSLVGAVVNVVINLLLIQYIGLYAVAISSFIAFLVMWLIRVYFAGAYFHIKINARDLLILLPIIAIAITVPFIVNWIGIGISIFLGVLLFFVYNWRLIRLVYANIKEIIMKPSRNL
ncbi:oligosaccharide flippase family protein [Lentibacillus sp. N15]|uniref:lipopolysaccharide biosynthesis protein n=1 Tax=Lentibacillus songyuanensis TaxID=3136161 RepID=UPI0031BB1FC1